MFPVLYCHTQLQALHADSCRSGRTKQETELTHFNRMTNKHAKEPIRTHVQGLTKRPFAGLVNFVPAVAYHSCLNLLEAFSQPGSGLLEVPCKTRSFIMDEVGTAVV